MELLTGSFTKLGTNPGQVLLDHQLFSWLWCDTVLVGGTQTQGFKSARSNLKHSSNEVDEDKPCRRRCSFPSGSWLWLDISLADFCCLIFFSRWLLLLLFQPVLGRWWKLVQATLLATTHPCYSTVKGMGKLVGLHSLHQMSEMLLNGRLVNHFRFHLSYHVHLHKGNYLYGTLICLYSLWEKSWFNRNETSDHPEGVIILQCHLVLQPSPRWEDAPQAVLAS